MVKIRTDNLGDIGVENIERKRGMGDGVLGQIMGLFFEMEIHSTRALFKQMGLAESWIYKPETL